MNEIDPVVIVVVDNSNNMYNPDCCWTIYAFAFTTTDYIGQ